MRRLGVPFSRGDDRGGGGGERPSRADERADTLHAWHMQAALQDPEKPMCVGVQTTPVWGDHGNYTGRCRFGAPIAPMQAAVATRGTVPYKDVSKGVTFGCGMAILPCWQGLERFAEDGLSFKEWIVTLVLAAAFGAAGGRSGYVLVRRFNPSDDDEDE